MEDERGKVADARTGAEIRGAPGRVVFLALVAGALAACSGGTRAETGEPPDSGRYNLGHAATPAEIAAVDIDVGPGGVDLPPGKGTVVQGAMLYGARCAACHGLQGEGIAPNPRLIGRDPRAGFPFGRDPRFVKTIGNYWPYAPTVFDYIRRAMPLTAPGSLSNDQVYALTAYLLAQNQVIPGDAALDAASLRQVKMPARDRFVRDDRKGGPEVR